MKRFERIQDSFKEGIRFENNKLLINQEMVKGINNEIPDFIIEDLDNLTSKMADFYNDVRFPNYDDFDDYNSIYGKGMSNIFTKRLDEEIGYGTNILEMGCGTGQLSLFLSRSNRNIFAVDISNSSLKLGEEFRRENRIKNTFFMRMDVFDLKFKKNNFDCVISNGVLHHTKDAEKAFKCLVEVTKPGGVLVIGLYHKYGRIVTRIKQKIANIIGEKISYLDKKSRRIKSKEKRRSWVKDQFMNPYETLHTPYEVLSWFNENNIDFLNLIPYYDIKDNRLIKKNKVPNITFIDNLSMALNSSQIQEGGFFIIIGKKKSN